MLEDYSLTIPFTGSTIVVENGLGKLPRTFQAELVMETEIV